jgi:hypothetical protein
LQRAAIQIIIESMDPELQKKLQFHPLDPYPDESDEFKPEWDPETRARVLQRSYELRKQLFDAYLDAAGLSRSSAP